MRCSSEEEWGKGVILQTEHTVTGKLTIDKLLWSVLTGREYSRMAMKRITMVRRMSPMKRHLNLRHTMNFMVLHGLVNQKKEVSGRLKVIEKNIY